MQKHILKDKQIQQFNMMPFQTVYYMRILKKMFLFLRFKMIINN